MTMERLVAAARHGDYAAFRRALAGERRRLLARASRKVGEDDAQECVDTATMFAFRRFESRSGRLPLARWLNDLLDEAIESRPHCAETCYDA